MSSARKLKVFLCHSSSDKPAVRTLYQQLCADGVEPWLDEEELIPGQDWQREIPKAVRASDAIVVCLSRGSINKEGYVQKEIKDALDAADEKPEGTIFIIPLKLEECAIPDRLQRWQAGRLFEERGYEKLVRALQVRARELGVLLPEAPGTSDVSLPREMRNSIGMELVLIPAGEFRMGAEDGDSDEKPVHSVRISRPFYLGKYPVTQAQWEAVMRKNPSRFTGDASRPVENVSWTDVQEFLRRLSEKEGGKPYRLPSEAEWEYGARAGAATAYCFGDKSSQLGEYAWYGENAGGTTHPVGQLKPNAWGLYDVHGNVWEWVHDWYDAAYYQRSPVEDPRGPEEGQGKVVRGGSWVNGPGDGRVSFRRWVDPGYRYDDIGFRCAR
jgi:formylglycine-generating enzyme required for sulfatase activity